MSRLGAWARRAVPVVWLVLVWVLLWGTFSWANVISGTVVALVVLALFPLPHVAGTGWLRPGPTLRFAGRFVADLVVSSVQVAWWSIRRGPPIRSSVIEAPLHSDSEFVMTLVVETLSLVPGSVVIEVIPEQRALWAHVLGAADDEAVAGFRDKVSRVEADVLAALGRELPPALLTAGSTTPAGGAR